MSILHALSLFKMIWIFNVWMWKLSVGFFGGFLCWEISEMTRDLLIFRKSVGVLVFLWNCQDVDCFYRSRIKLSWKTKVICVWIFDHFLLFFLWLSEVWKIRVPSFYHAVVLIRGITFTHLKWSLVPLDFKEYCMRYSWKLFKF